MADAPFTLEPGPGQVEGTLLEGLAKALHLKPADALSLELKAIGYDLERPEPKYPDRVWRKALEVITRTLDPGVSYPEAERRLGTRWIVGARETIVGKVVLSTIPLLSVPMVLDRMPRFVGIASPLMSGEILEKGPTHRILKITLVDLAPTPYFLAGVLEAIVGAKRQCVVTVTEVTSRTYTLRITWTA